MPVCVSFETTQPIETNCSIRCLLRETCNQFHFDPQALQVKYRYEYPYLIFPFRLFMKTDLKTTLLASNTTTNASCEISITPNMTMRLLKRQPFGPTWGYDSRILCSSDNLLHTRHASNHQLYIKCYWYLCCTMIIPACVIVQQFGKGPPHNNSFTTENMLRY
jgi:hypothetical protein